MSWQSSCSAKHGFESSDDLLKSSLKWDEFVKELKVQWGKMWRERFDDKIRAEGVAIGDYPLLFLECGTVVIATRRYRAPDFFEILERHRGLSESDKSFGFVDPSIGGWGKFIRNVLSRQQSFTKRKRPEPAKSKGKENLQKKKGGRGWVHQF